MSKFIVSQIARLTLFNFKGYSSNANFHLHPTSNSQPFRFCSSSSSDGKNKPIIFPKTSKPQEEPYILSNDVPPEFKKKIQKKTKNVSVKTIMENVSPKKIKKSSTTPACAAFPNLTPLSEHEIGLDLSRRLTGKQGGANANENLTDNDEEAVKRYKKPRNVKKCKFGMEVLSQTDSFRRVHFAMKMLFMLEDEPEIINNILFTDECNFNLPNLPPPIITKPMFPQSEVLPQIAWCGMSSKGVVGPYFFNSYVTDKSYLKMLETFVLPELESQGYNLKDIWFQQDGAAWHRSRKVLDFLKSVFDYRVISFGTKFMWPPRSQDLTPMDYFFWDHLKDRLNYKHSKYDLCFQKGFREILTSEVQDVSLNVIKKAIYQLPERLEWCVNVNGERFNDMLGKPIPWDGNAQNERGSESDSSTDKAMKVEQDENNKNKK